MAAVSTANVFYANVTMLPDVARVLACLHEKKIACKPRDMSKEGGYPVPDEFLEHQASNRIVGPIYTDGEETLVESRAICRSVCERYPGRGNQLLLGKNSLERASVEQWLKFEQHDFDPPSWTLVFHLAFAQAKPDLVLLDQSERKLASILDVYDDRLTERSYLAGDEFSLADLCHLPNSHYLANSGDWGYLFSSRKHVWKWFKRISERKSWKEARKILDVHSLAAAAADDARSQREIGVVPSRMPAASQKFHQPKSGRFTRQRQKPSSQAKKPVSLAQEATQGEPSTPPRAMNGEATSTPSQTLLPQHSNAPITSPSPTKGLFPSQKAQSTLKTPKRSAKPPPSSQTIDPTSDRASNKVSSSTGLSSQPMHVASTIPPSPGSSHPQQGKAEDASTTRIPEPQSQHSTSPTLFPSLQSKDSIPSKTSSNNMPILQIQPSDGPETQPTTSRSLSPPRQAEPEHVPMPHESPQQTQSLGSPNAPPDSKIKGSSIHQIPASQSSNDKETSPDQSPKSQLPSITPENPEKIHPPSKQNPQNAMTTTPTTRLPTKLPTSLAKPYSSLSEESTLGKVPKGPSSATMATSPTSAQIPQSSTHLPTSPSPVKDSSFSATSSKVHKTNSLEPELAQASKSPTTSSSSQTKDPTSTNDTKAKQLQASLPIQSNDPTSALIIQKPSSDDNMGIRTQSPVVSNAESSLESGLPLVRKTQLDSIPPENELETQSAGNSKMSLSPQLKESHFGRKTAHNPSSNDKPPEAQATQPPLPSTPCSPIQGPSNLEARVENTMPNMLKPSAGSTKRSSITNDEASIAKTPEQPLMSSTKGEQSIQPMSTIISPSKQAHESITESLDSSDSRKKQRAWVEIPITEQPSTTLPKTTQSMPKVQPLPEFLESRSLQPEKIDSTKLQETPSEENKLLSSKQNLQSQQKSYSVDNLSMESRRDASTPSKPESQT